MGTDIVDAMMNDVTSADIKIADAIMNDAMNAGKGIANAM